MIACVTASLRAYQEWIEQNNLDKDEYILVKTERDAFGKTFESYISLYGVHMIPDKDYRDIMVYFDTHNIKRIHYV